MHHCANSQAWIARCPPRLLDLLTDRSPRPHATPPGIRNCGSAAVMDYVSAPTWPVWTRRDHRGTLCSRSCNGLRRRGTNRGTSGVARSCGLAMHAGRSVEAVQLTGGRAWYQTSRRRPLHPKEPPKREFCKTLDHFRWICGVELHNGESGYEL